MIVDLSQVVALFSLLRHFMPCPERFAFQRRRPSGEDHCRLVLWIQTKKGIICHPWHYKLNSPAIAEQIDLVGSNHRTRLNCDQAKR